MIFKDTPEGCVISLHIQPNASKSEIIGRHGEALKVKIKAPPVDGKANMEIIRFLSGFLDISKNKVEILKGDKSKLKKVLLRGMTSSDVKVKIIL